MAVTDHWSPRRSFNVWSFVFTLTIGSVLLVASFLVAGLTLNLLDRQGWEAVMWGTGLLFAAGLALAGLAAILDAAAGLDPHSLRWLYGLAFLMASLAWLIGAIVIVLVIIAAFAIAATGGGSINGLDAVQGYGGLKPKNRGDER